MNSTTAKIPPSESEEYFRHVVCNLTSLKPDDPVFDRIKEEDKRMIKEAGKALKQEKK